MSDLLAYYGSFTEEETTKRIVTWNAKRNGLKYDEKLEIMMLLEELTEFLEAETLVDKLDAAADFIFVAEGTYAKNNMFPLGGFIIACLKIMQRSLPQYIHNTYMSDIVVACVNIVLEANERKGFELDENGKVMKGDDYVAPEETITALLKELVDGTSE